MTHNKLPFPRRFHPAKPWRRALMPRQPYSKAILSSEGRLPPIDPMAFRSQQGVLSGT